MPKALVLGGATGLVGQALTKVLQKNGWETQSLGRQDGNLAETSFIANALAKADADVIFNTIAWTQVDEAEDHPNEAIEVNRLFADALSRAIAALPNGHLVHYSTDFVFSGQPPEDYWKETDATNPPCIYGSSKLEGEKAVLRNLPDRSCVIRTAWLFGPGRKNFVSTILNAAQKNPSLTVVDDQMGCPTYTMDLAAWSLALAEKRATGVWHCVNSGHATWCDLAEEAINLASIPCKIQPIHSNQWPQKAKRPRNSILSNNKLAKFLGVKPRPWPLALREYIFADYKEDAK